MPPDRFEALVTELLLQMGFDENTVRITPYGNDGGIDVVGIYRAAGLTEVNAAVQVKRWKRNIQAPIVTQLRGSLQVHQQGIIITTSGFSKGAQAEATAPNKTRIGLINGDELLELLIKHRVGVTEKTLRVIGLDDEWWGELIKPDDIASVEATAEVVPTPQIPVRKQHPKPKQMTLMGQEFPINTWKEILLITCTTLANEQEQSFIEKALTIRGRTRPYFSSNPEDLFKPEQIGDKEVWVETNFSAKDIVKLCNQLLIKMGHQVDDLTIELPHSSA